MLNKVSNGDKLHITAAAPIVGGAPVVVGSLVGVAVNDAAIGQLVALELQGVFSLPKTTGAGTDIAAGDLVYLNSSGVITKTASGNTLAGAAFAPASTTDGVVDVRLKQ